MNRGEQTEVPALRRGSDRSLRRGHPIRPFQFGRQGRINNRNPIIKQFVFFFRLYGSGSIVVFWMWNDAAAVCCGSW